MTNRSSNLPSEDQADIGQLRQQEGVSGSSAGGRSSGATSGTGGSSSSSSTGTGDGFRYNPNGDQAGRSENGGATSSTTDSNPDSTSNIKNREEAAGSGSSSSTSDTPSRYNNSDGGDNNGDWKVSLNSNATSKKRFKFTARKTVAGVGTTIAVIGGVFGVTSIVQGPMTFVHFGELLQKFHLNGNNTFGDDRSSKLLIYALLGKTERGRLGMTGNKAADVWEKRLINEFGLQPVYTNSTGRFAGFQVINTKDARGLDPNGKAMQFIEAMEAEGKIKVRGGTDRGGQRVRTSGGQVLGRLDVYLDYRDLTSRQKRSSIRGIGKETGTFNIVGALNSRFLVKRGGVNFRFFHNEKLRTTIDKVADRSEERKRRADYEKNILKRWAAMVKAGVKKGEGKNQEAKEVAEEVETETEGKSAVESKTLRTAAAKAAGPAAAVGIFCGVKSLGDDAEATKYANNVLPMMRMGMSIVSIGSQIKFGSNTLNADELGVMYRQLRDKETKTSFNEARSFQAELGNPGMGPDVPREAKLGKISDKGGFFETVDALSNIGLGPVDLGGACSVIDTVADLPLISQLSSLMQDAINGPLGLVGLSTEELMGDLIAAINGASVNPLAKGAELGNLATVGVFMAGVDNARSLGGAALSAADSLVLKQEQREIAMAENANKSFAQRYLDPYDSQSLASSMAVSIPDTSSTIAAITSGFGSLFSSGFGNIGKMLSPTASAALSDYDYGIPKYGYTLEEREDPRFEDPFENAAIIEQGNTLSDLNEKYGQKCFGMIVRADDSGVHVETEGQDSENVNVFKVRKNHPECDPKNNNDEMFLRYRFYLADSVTAVSLACFEGNDTQACSELQAGSADNDPDNGPSEAPGVTVDIANLGKSSDKLSCAEGTKDIGVVTSKYNDVHKKEPGPMRIRLCQIPDIPGQGNNTKGQNISGGAVVEARVSGAWAALAKKAKADGIKLTSSSSFRLADSCGGTGDGTGCAKPGKSAHQTGWAIDFGDMGGFEPTGSFTSCSGRMTWDSPQWKWMKENAPDFGPKQYSAEAWHWDFLPLENRCGK